MTRRCALALWMALAWISSSPVSFAQELEARAYANTPVDMNFLAVGYGYATGNVFFDPALPIENAEARMNLAFARYLRTFPLFGKPAKAKAVLPWANGHWDGLIEGELNTQDSTGLADARIGLDVLFSGAEPTRRSEFASYQQGTIVGASLDLVMPTGDYDTANLVNLGSNRWAFNPELAVSHRLAESWVLEGVLGAWIFTDNDEFLGDLRLEQDELFVAKFHLIHDIRPGFWLGVGTGLGYGGTTRVDGVVRDTRQENWRLGATVAYALAPDHGVSLSLLTGRNFGAGADLDAITVAYQYSWGGD